MRPSFHDVVLDYYKSGASKTQRFGQFFINYYLGDDNVPWPELFYEADIVKAMTIVAHYYKTGEEWQTDSER